MKYSILVVAALFAGLFLSTGNVQAQSTFESWPALSAFHKVMAQTFHPMEDGDLQPIRTRSGEMVARANDLKASVIPAEFNKPEIKKAVAKLKKDSKKLHQRIKKGAGDEEIKASLTALHDTFHTIVGLCSATGEHH